MEEQTRTTEQDEPIQKVNAPTESEGGLVESRDKLTALYETVVEGIESRGELDEQGISDALFDEWLQAALQNGDCGDMDRVGIVRLGPTGYRVDAFLVDEQAGELRIGVADFSAAQEGRRVLHTAQIDAHVRRIERFLGNVQDDSWFKTLDREGQIYPIARTIRRRSTKIARVRLCLFTDAVVSLRTEYSETSIGGWPAVVTWVDLQRLASIMEAGETGAPVRIDVPELNGGSGIEVIDSRSVSDDARTYLAVISGDFLARVYGAYGGRVLEQNVRSFLQVGGMVNKGIVATLATEPERFLAFNNGITATASSVTVNRCDDGTLRMTEIADLQIVNGGQTTACISYARDRKRADLDGVQVQMKLSVIAPEKLDEFVPRIARYANTQNKITNADLFSNHPFHVSFEQRSRKVLTDSASGPRSRWFYERARGQYATALGALRGREKKEFETLYPRHQCLSKTDVARSRTIFDYEPHIASLGVQKCAKNFAERTERAWQAHKGARANANTNLDEREASAAQAELIASFIDESYFVDTVAKEILFRKLDKEFAKTPAYTNRRQHKTKTVIYALARFAYRLRMDKGCEIDFALVWKEQDIPKSMRPILLEATIDTHQMLHRNANRQDVHEAAKKAQMWESVKSRTIEFPPSFTEFSNCVGSDRARPRGLNALAGRRAA